jgi:hypothetical protein
MIIVIDAAVAVVIITTVAVPILLLLLYSSWEESVTQVYAIILNLTSYITLDNFPFLTHNC